MTVPGCHSPSPDLPESRAQAHSRASFHVGLHWPGCAILALRLRPHLPAEPGRERPRKKERQGAPLPRPAQGDGDTHPGLVRISVQKASWATTDSILIRRLRRLPGGPSRGGHPSCRPRAIKSSCPETSHAISSERAQPHLRLLQTHFQQTAVLRSARGPAAGVIE